MDVVMLFGIVALVGGVGGLGNGIQIYGGLLLPQTIKRPAKLGEGDNAVSMEVSMWIPGGSGQALLGAVSALIVFCLESKVNFVLIGEQVSKPVLTAGELGMALLVGFGGSTVFNNWLQGKDFKKLAPVIQQVPSNNRAVLNAIGTNRAYEVLKALPLV